MQKAVPIQPNTVGGARQPTPALQSTASLAQPNTPNVTATNIAEVFTNASTAFARFGEVCRALKAQPSEGSNSGSDPTETQRWREDCIELLRAATSRFATDLCAIAEAQRTRQLATLKEEFQRKSYAEVGLVYPDDVAYTNEADEYGAAAMNDGTAYEAGYGDAVYAEGAEYANAVYAEADGTVNATQSAAGVETDAEQKAAESEIASVNDSVLVQAANESEAAYLHASASAPATNGANHTQLTEYSSAPAQEATSDRELLNVSATESQSEALAAHFVGEIEIEKL